MSSFDFFLHLAGVALLALALCSAILLALLKTGLASRLATDVPNDRSLHTRPVPRIGGWGIVPAVCVLIGALASGLWMTALLAALLALLSQIDDRRGLPARVRFAGHVAAVAALIVVYPAQVPWWFLGGLGFALVWLVNLYNFMDGANGLAGGMALFGFGGYAVAATISIHADPSLAMACAIVAGAASGFLLFNFNPARLFLGDVGSIPLGFLAGALGYWGWLRGVWPLWFPAMVFLPFIADASVTLLKRLARGEKFWQAHREHYYQRIIRSGISHSETAGIWYLGMASGVVIGCCALTLGLALQLTVVALWCLVLVCAGLLVDRRWRLYVAHSENRSKA
ncbi:glycosyltransferase family 4 protein [Paraburkholderia sp. PREW-6R]|uniref:MraY family glycosyltransferase n=1 Tax=Paraburkholderia sp. PREW-6R TaxID=3141544 RepID=UPI0031F5CE04